MDYSKLSDFEINRAVAIAIGFHPDECDIAKRGTPSVGVEWNEDTGYATKTFDPCSDPADAWPIIYRHKISIEFDGDNSTEPQTTWCHARNMYRSCGINYQSNPLRAAMIVFLMMQDSKL